MSNRCLSPGICTSLRERIVPKDAKLAERNPLIKPWKELADDGRKIEVRGMEVYTGMVNAMDYHYGRVVKFLKDVDEYDHTIIVFLSDHGENPWYSADDPVDLLDARAGGCW